MEEKDLEKQKYNENLEAYYAMENSKPLSKKSFDEISEQLLENEKKAY